MENGKVEAKRTLVIPGELLSEGSLTAGKNTYKRENKVYASQMGFKSITANYVNVIPLSGRYIPKPDDLVIGIIQSVSPTTWLVDVNSPYPAPLHVNEVPWRVDFGDTARYLNAGDTVLARIFLVDEIKRIQVTMKDQGSRKLTGGQIIEVSPSKVPRIIGKGGSMISLIKQKTMCRLFVGQNGRIWIDGDPEKIQIAVNAIRFIERESHKFGLTESVERYLNNVLSGKEDDKPVVPMIQPHQETKHGRIQEKTIPLDEKDPETSVESINETTTHPLIPSRPEPETEPGRANIHESTNADEKETDGIRIREPKRGNTTVAQPSSAEQRDSMKNVLQETKAQDPSPHLNTGTTDVPDSQSFMKPEVQKLSLEGESLGSSGGPGEIEKPKEQILKDEEFERMSD